MCEAYSKRGLLQRDNSLRLYVFTSESDATGGLAQLIIFSPAETEVKDNDMSFVCLFVMNTSVTARADKNRDLNNK